MSSFLIKFDGYRALAIKSRGKVQLRSRNDNDFSSRYLGIVKALAAMPDETVIDGEVVALDEDGRPSFNLLLNYGSAGAPLHFFIFDVLVLKGRDGRVSDREAQAAGETCFPEDVGADPLFSGARREPQGSHPVGESAEA
jgi:ATP-dependent DNA ligase